MVDTVLSMIFFRYCESDTKSVSTIRLSSASVMILFATISQNVEGIEFSYEYENLKL